MGLLTQEEAEEPGSQGKTILLFSREPGIFKKVTAADSHRKISLRGKFSFLGSLLNLSTLFNISF